MQAVKLSTVTEIGYFARLVRGDGGDFVTPVMNLILALDLPDDWWKSRESRPLGEWWRELSVPESLFRQEHGIDAP